MSVERDGGRERERVERDRGKTEGRWEGKEGDSIYF